MYKNIITIDIKARLLRNIFGITSSSKITQETVFHSIFYAAWISILTKASSIFGRKRNFMNVLFMQNVDALSRIRRHCCLEQSHAIILLVHRARHIHGTSRGGGPRNDTTNSPKVITITCHIPGYFQLNIPNHTFYRQTVTQFRFFVYIDPVTVR